MSKFEISDLQLDAELVELSDEVAEQVTGGGWFTNALHAVINWIGKPNDGSIGGALEATGRAVIASPAVGGLSLWAAAEQKLLGH